MVHDAARPLASRDAVATGWSTALATGADAVVPAVPVTDTLARASAAAPSTASRFVAVQTPQAFRADGSCAGPTPAAPRPPTTPRWSRPSAARCVVVDGEPANIKITTPHDLRGHAGLRA